MHEKPRNQRDIRPAGQTHWPPSPDDWAFWGPHMRDALGFPEGPPLFDTASFSREDQGVAPDASPTFFRKRGR